eukprot:11972-Heterococcus_DN1.PRE.1
MSTLVPCGMCMGCHAWLRLRALKCMCARKDFQKSMRSYETFFAKRRECHAARWPCTYLCHKSKARTLPDRQPPQQHEPQPGKERRLRTCVTWSRKLLLGACGGCWCARSKQLGCNECEWQPQLYEQE